MNHQAILSDKLTDYVRGIMRRGSPRDARRLVRVIRNAGERRAAVESATGVHIPEMCFFSVTYSCNLECVGCYAKGLPTKDNLTTDQIANILRETTAAGTVLYAIAGGEPLSVEGLIDVLAEKSDGIYMVFTNGVLLDRAAARTIASAGNILPVLSIEGDPADTDNRRGDGTDAAVRRAMSLLRAERVPFAYSTMVTHRNLRRVTGRQYQLSMWDAGARFGFLVDYVPIPGTLDPDLVLTEADRAVKHAAVAARVAEARPMVVNFPEAEYSSGGCMSAGTGFLHISATGAVEPCTFSHFSTHNLRTTSYVEALDSEFFRSVRGRFANRPNPTGTCLLFQHEAEVAQLARECAGAPTEEPVHL